MQDSDNMIEEIFNIESFNIVSDDDNYYFFRALNNRDNNDIESGNTYKDGELLRIKTDCQNYNGISKYEDSKEISLEEVFDHIKMHHRTDTNCISLTSNANVGVMYGRAYYKDRYTIIKVPKNKLGDKVVVAGLYILQEIQKS